MLLNPLLSQVTIVCLSRPMRVVTLRLYANTISQPSTVLLRPAYSLSEPVLANSPRLNFSLCSIVQQIR